MLMIVPVSLLRDAERGRDFGGLFEGDTTSGGRGDSDGVGERESESGSRAQVFLHECILGEGM